MALASRLGMRQCLPAPASFVGPSIPYSVYPPPGLLRRPVHPLQRLGLFVGAFGLLLGGIELAQDLLQVLRHRPDEEDHRDAEQDDHEQAQRRRLAELRALPGWRGRICASNVGMSLEQLLAWIPPDRPMKRWRGRSTSISFPRTSPSSWTATAAGRRSATCRASRGTAPASTRCATSSKPRRGSASTC